MSAIEAAQPHMSNSFFSAGLADADPDIARAIDLELGRQRDEIELIASENIVSRAVLEAQGSVMTNKYAEGYPGRRYYGGCQFVDVAENLAIERACRLFDCRFANVQPNSGSQANQAVFMALLQPGDTFMGLDLAAGGHLTHGSPVNMSGKWFKVVSYGVRQDDQRLDMDEVERLAHEHKPKLIIAGGSAYARALGFRQVPRDRRRGRRLLHGRHGAFRRARGGRRASLAVSARPRRDHDDAQDAARPARRHDPHQRRGHRQEDQLGGLPGPAGRAADARHRRQGGRLRRGAAARVQALCPCRRRERQGARRDRRGGGFDIVSGGTDNHLMLVDLRPKKLTGKRAEAALGRAHITCNKNGVPFDPEKPTVTSGIRLGTPAGTTRGFGVAEFQRVGELIVEVLDGLAKSGEDGNAAVEAEVKQRAHDLTARFPIYA